MCFIVFAYDSHPKYALILAANRDEFYERPTAPAQFWEALPQVLGGRDLKGGGTWLGITKHGRFAALTNIREPENVLPLAPSRGELVCNYLRSEQIPSAFVSELAASSRTYNGYNLLIGDTESLYYQSNRHTPPQNLSAGVYALSNHLLDTPWPKVRRGKALFSDAMKSEQVHPDALLEVLLDQARPSDDQLPSTGVPLEWERVLSPVFIQTPTYGTRCSTVLLIDRHGVVSFLEYTHAVGGFEAKRREFQFSIHATPVSE